MVVHLYDINKHIFGLSRCVCVCVQSSCQLCRFANAETRVHGVLNSNYVFCGLFFRSDVYHTVLVTSLHFTTRMVHFRFLFISCVSL